MFLYVSGRSYFPQNSTYPCFQFLHGTVLKTFNACNQLILNILFSCANIYISASFWQIFFKICRKMRTNYDRQNVFNNCDNIVHQVAALDDVSHESAQHDAFMASLHESFTGRQLLLKHCLTTLRDMSSGVALLSGKQGVGKTALMVGQLMHPLVSPG